MRLLDLVEHYEGYRRKPYRDTRGKLTIGYGRNLDDVGLSRAEALHLLANDVQAIREHLSAQPWWPQEEPVRQDVLVTMAYQMGVRGLLGFTKMLAAVNRCHWNTAALEMLDSEWARQTPKRAQELALMMKSGEMLWPENAADADSLPGRPHGPATSDSAKPA